jgi:hypothetical protein
MMGRLGWKALSKFLQSAAEAGGEEIANDESESERETLKRHPSMVSGRETSNEIGMTLTRSRRYDDRSEFRGIAMIYIPTQRISCGVGRCPL